MATASQGPWGPTNAAPSSALTRENASGTRINATGRSENEIERRRKRRRRHENPRRQREKPRPEEDRDGGKKRERRTENPHPRQGLARNLLVLSVRTEHPWKLAAVRFRLGLFVTHSRCVSLLSFLFSFFSFSSFFFFFLLFLRVLPPFSATCHRPSSFSFLRSSLRDFSPPRRLLVRCLVRARVLDESVKLPLSDENVVEKLKSRQIGRCLGLDIRQFNDPSPLDVYPNEHVVPRTSSTWCLRSATWPDMPFAV